MTPDPTAPPVMDRIADLVYCRRCGQRLGVDAVVLAGLAPAPQPHTTCPTED